MKSWDQLQMVEGISLFETICQISPGWKGKERRVWIVILRLDDTSVFSAIHDRQRKRFRLPVSPDSRFVIGHLVSLEPHK
jgi:hypothetical protein